MGTSIQEMRRPVRRRLQRIVQKTMNKNYARRALAILYLHEGKRVTDIAKQLCAARSSVGHWRTLYETYGEAGLVPETRGCRPSTVDESLCHCLLILIQSEPMTYGYFRSRWTSEMLAQQVFEETGRVVHSSTVRRLLPKLGIVWRRARPTLCIKDKHKSRKMKAINQALDSASAEHPVFYTDEVDIDLNPRIGPGWTQKGQQIAVPTPGKNQKRYLAGALNAQTGNVVWVAGERKNSFLFIQLLAELRKRYRKAKTIRLIADNYIIHKSGITQCFLRNNPKFKLLFQPIYHPWVNKIERLWKQLHDMVTRNHRHNTIGQLMNVVEEFMLMVSPFPGGLSCLQKV